LISRRTSRRGIVPSYETKAAILRRQGEAGGGTTYAFIADAEQARIE
jgi:hypothetical protein